MTCGSRVVHCLKRVGEMVALQKGVFEECLLGSRRPSTMSIFKAQEGWGCMKLTDSGFGLLECVHLTNMHWEMRRRLVSPQGKC